MKWLKHFTGPVMVVLLLRMAQPAVTLNVPSENMVQVSLTHARSLVPVTAWDEPSFTAQVVELVNIERWNNGQLPPLKANDLLQTAAQTHSDNMAARDFFAHCDLDTGISPWTRIMNAGYIYNTAAENIAAGYSTPEAVVSGWMNSEDHRANILSSNFREIGVGYTFQGDDQENIRRDNDGDCNADGTYAYAFYHYWVQNFGRRNSLYPVVIEREAYETDTPQVQLYMYGQGWATEMRFRNEGGDWLVWQPYHETTMWALSDGNGLKTVEAEIRNSSGTVLTAADTIWLHMLVVDPLINLSPLSITFLVDTAVSTTLTQTVHVHNMGALPLNWTTAAQPAVSWLNIASPEGSTPGGATSDLALIIDLQGADRGTYAANLVVSGNATNSPQVVPITVIVADLKYAYLPFVLQE